ncbi:hypothetical protein AUP44_18360 [Tistrella mobilis]|uniref:Uncharacterized protein n=2 Tax=Tistrella mobilis TaxID=171437 RepID=A0A162JI71_9PROT|nr:hypothetical protein AUP44_18360 [Tistrella mobilis]
MDICLRCCPMNDTRIRHVRLLRKGRNQDTYKYGLVALLDSWEPMDEALPEPKDQPTVPEDMF